eukprot:5341878-Prymnesium_polylepis.1
MRVLLLLLDLVEIVLLGEMRLVLGLHLLLLDLLLELLGAAEALQQLGARHEHRVELRAAVLLLAACALPQAREQLEHEQLAALRRGEQVALIVREAHARDGRTVRSEQLARPIRLQRRVVQPEEPRLRAHKQEVLRRRELQLRDPAGVGAHLLANVAALNLAQHPVTPRRNDRGAVLVDRARDRLVLRALEHM